MITLQNLSYSYPHTPPVFTDFCWEAKRGEAWAVLGPSGGGKTTLLYLLSGLVFPSAGQVLIDGALLTHPRPLTGLILQDYGLLPWATLRQNAELGQRVQAFYGPDGKHAPRQPRLSINAQPWLNRLGLAELAEKYPNQVSGGQRQRAAIARTLALQPDLLLMDEPFSSLDAPTREDLQSLILELQGEQNLTLVIVTHSIEEAAVLGKKILLLGRPPNQNAMVIENPQSGQADFRGSEAYTILCRELRARMNIQG